MTAAVCAQTLSVGATLGVWRIEGVQGVVGDAVLYSALHAETGDAVFLQEFFPPGAGARTAMGSVSPREGAAGETFLTGRETFLVQGAALAGLCAARPVPHLPRVRSVFMEGGTAYMVMDRYGGTPLATELDLQRRLPEDQLLALFRPLALALGQLHSAGVCHLRIHPAVILRQNRRLLLTGFSGGAPLRGWEDGPEAAYSPIELLVPVASPGPWSDVYALGAVLYHCMTGEPPPQAQARLGAIDWPIESGACYSPRFREAVASALACVPMDRPRSMKDWCAAWPHRLHQAAPLHGNGEGLGEPHLAPMRRDEGGQELILLAPQSEHHLPVVLHGRWLLLWPYLAGAAVAGGLALAFVAGRSLFPAGGDPEQAALQTAGPQGLRPGLAGPGEPSAPLMLLEQETAFARDAARHVAQQAAEAQALKWPGSRIRGLEEAAARAAAAVRELEALHAAPRAGLRPATQAPENTSFAAVLAQQRKIIRAAVQEAWAISVAGYAAAAEPLVHTAEANFKLLETLLAGDRRPEPALLLGTTGSAHALLGTAYERLQRAARAEPPSDPVIASRQAAEISLAYDEVREQSAIIRGALRKGREHAAAREAEQRTATSERRQFSAALVSARRTIAELEQAMRKAAEGSLPDQLKQDALLQMAEAKRRISGLEHIVLDTPDLRGERLQAALVEVRETENEVRSLLREVRGRSTLVDASDGKPEIKRLLRRADTRLTRNNRRYADLQKLLARHGGAIRAIGGEQIGRQEVGGLYRHLLAQISAREHLAKAKTEPEATAIYQKFLALHEKVDRELDRMLRAATKAERL